MVQRVGFNLVMQSILQ